MSPGWAVHLARDGIHSIPRLRLIEDAEIHVQEDGVWLRGSTLDATLAGRLRRLAHARYYHVLADGQLVAPGQLVPDGHVPEGPWQPLQTWLSIELPVAVFAGRVDGRVPLRLVRTTDEQPSSMLLTEFSQWLNYAGRAPQIRLERWSFAVRADGQTAIRGRPLPPLPGVHFVETSGIAVAAGWTWQPKVDVGTLRKVFQIEDQDLVLWSADNTWERIAAGYFIPATRASVRLSARTRGHA